MEDIPVLEKWFALVKDTIDHYGVYPPDMYNFNETRFMIGVVIGFTVITRTDRRETHGIFNLAIETG